ncbi:MAG: family 43 glycosylhydrolase [Candidatus Eisenbacteria bacterium]
MRPRRAAFTAAFLTVAACFLGAGPLLASWMVPPAPYTAKDFSIVKRNGLYHLFYIRNNSTLPFGSTQKDLGHATSADMYFWTQHPPVLSTRPGFFDNSHVWAPSIVERDGVYYMFYTGVADSAGLHALDQRTGLASSTDLFTWNRVDVPIFSCLDVPWTWCDSLASTPFRDPHVMADPTTPGRWLMVYSSALASDPAGMMVGVASSMGDFTAWQDEGPLGITSRFITFSDVAESPHLFLRNGVWFLFFTTNSGQPLSFATSANPLAPTNEWTLRGRLTTMLGYTTEGWFASEQFRDGLIDYFMFVNGDRVEMQKMTWLPFDRFSLSQPDLFHVMNLIWGSTTVRAGQEASLFIESKWRSGRSAALESFWLDGDDNWHPVANAVLGIPDQIALTADMHEFSWLARSLPDSLGAPETVRIVVRTTDQTATSNPIQLLPQAGDLDPGVDPPPPPVGSGSAGTEEIHSFDAGPKLRSLRLGMLGGLPSVVVDLSDEQPARLEVFDLLGRRVRTLADRRLPAGASVLVWDGRDDAGRRLGRGIYFARLNTPGAARTTRIMLR